MVDIVERLRTEAPCYVLIGDAAVEIERLRETLRLERQLRDHALALAVDLQKDIDRLSGYSWSVAEALKQKEAE